MSRTPEGQRRDRVLPPIRVSEAEQAEILGALRPGETLSAVAREQLLAWARRR